MQLIITIKSYKSVGLELKDKKQVIDAVDFSFDKNLDTLLILSIDKFLKRNKIDKSALNRVRIGFNKGASNIDKNSSLYKIIQAFKAAVEI